MAYAHLRAPGPYPLPPSAGDFAPGGGPPSVLAYQGLYFRNTPINFPSFTGPFLPASKDPGTSPILKQNKTRLSLHRTPFQFLLCFTSKL